MNIKINKPSAFSDNKIIEFNDSTIKTIIDLDINDIKELFNLLDIELNYGQTRENLITEIQDLRIEIQDLYDKYIN